MTGKIRVSIVATALDGHKTDNKTVLNMFSRAQNRNTGYSENLFSQSSRIEGNALNSIDGATALKLDESFQLEEQELKDTIYNLENQTDKQNFQKFSSELEDTRNNLPSGLSIESASYMENNNLVENINKEEQLNKKIDSVEEYTPKLFSEDHNHVTEEAMDDVNNQTGDTEQLFDQDINEDEDFEIPAFLRKQKF